MSIYSPHLIDFVLILCNSMKRIEANQDWSLFCPNEAPGLADVWGPEFDVLFEKYEKEGRARKTMPAQKLWYAILESQIETGGPFMLYKDAANSKFPCSLNLAYYLIKRSQANQTRRTWVPSSHPISAQRLSSTPHLTRRPFATWRLSPSQLSSPTANTTSKDSTMSPRLSRTT